KRVNGHVEQEDVLHFFAEAAEMGAHEEVAMKGREFAQRAALEQLADATHTRNEAAVLHNGVDAAGSSGLINEGAGSLKAGGHRLFAEHMAFVAQARFHHVFAGSRDDDIEKEVRL